MHGRQARAVVGNNAPVAAVCDRRGSSIGGHAGGSHPPSTRDTVIAFTEQVEHHRWAASGAARGLTPLDVRTLAALRQLRWREVPRNRTRTGWMLAVVAALHALFGAVIWREMQPPPAVAVMREAPRDVMHVRFIERAPTAPAAAPPPVPSPPALPRHPPPREPAAEATMTMQLPAPKPVEATHLYGRDGQPLLPAASASSAPPGYVARALQGDSRVMRHVDPIKYKATSLDKYFPPPDETAGGAALRQVVDAVIKDKAVNLPGGIHLKCKTVLGIPTPDCTNPPPPPSAKDGDERLSMAPAKPLAADPNAPKPPSVEACIAIYRAGKPLPWGCPPDTPNRSVDAELRDRAAGAARAH